MRLAMKLAAVVGLASILSACSDSGHKKYFETQGLRAPVAHCEAKPSQFGIAEPVGTIDEGNGCEVPDPWRVYSLSNVNFSQPATLTCGMVSPLDDWMQRVVQPAAQRSFGESVIAVTVASSYSCRPRNNQRGAKMSEHGFGNAIDIGGFTLESGRTVTVLAGWSGSREDQRFLRQVREDACEDFMTVLGPGSDAHHRDHIHLDLQNRRSGSRLCR